MKARKEILAYGYIKKENVSLYWKEVR